MDVIRVVGVLMLRDEKVYLAKRINPAKSLPNHYCDAGGHIENGETVLQAARREMQEETGLRSRRPLDFHGSELVDVNGRAVKVYLCVARLHEDEVPAVPAEEAANLESWTLYSLDEALALPLVPGTRAGLLKLKVLRAGV